MPMKAIGSHIRQIARTSICRLGNGGTVLLRSLVEGRVSLENRILLMVVIVGSAETPRYMKGSKERESGRG